MTLKTAHISKKCPICGTAFTPNRENQIYCKTNGSKCRNYANNKKASAFRKEMDPAKTILEGNRKAILRILNGKKEALFSRDYLAGAGIDLRYFTHNIKGQDGSIQSQIFDFGVVQLKDNQVKIYKHG
jgi:hypothetical protein